LKNNFYAISTTKINILISTLEKIAYDRSSGSIDLVFAVLDAFTAGFDGIQKEMTENTVHNINLALRKLDKYQGSFIVLHQIILNLKTIFSTQKPDLQQLNSLINSTKEYYNNLQKNQAKAFLSLGIKSDIILLHSNSRSVKQFLMVLRSYQTNIKKIYQTVSTPGAEGLIQAKFLQDHGFLVEVINDEHINSIASNIDVAFFGADLILPDSFINKVNTNIICQSLQTEKVPVFVLADKNKKVEPNDIYRFKSGLLKITDFEGNRLFEEIPNHLITKYFIYEPTPKSSFSS